MQFLQKNNSQEPILKEKLTVSSMLKVPEVHNLCRNKLLNLSQIEALLVLFSNEHYSVLQSVNIQGKIEVGTNNYHLWIYSLLALHQSYAPYSNFEALASINASIEREHLCLTGF
jgi:hypothetical protein